MRDVRGLLSLLAVTVVLVSCAGPTAAPDTVTSGKSAEPATDSGHTKRVSAVLRGNPFTLSEAINAAGSGSVPGVGELQELIHAGLGVEDDQRQLRPRLAEELPTVENGRWKVFPDGTMETTWVLRPDILWHDGTPLTSDDFAFTVKVAQDRQVSLSGGAAFRLIDSVETPDPRTFTVRWSKPYIRADALFTNTGGSRVLPMPRHLLESAYASDPANLTQLPYWTAEWVGLGPFKLREYREGSHLVIEASDRYFLGRPPVDEIEVKFMPDPSTIAANLLAGTAELTLGGRFSLEWGVAVRDQWREGRMETPVGTSWVALYPQLLNPTPAVLGEVPFRQALLHAINRQEMSDTIQAGLSPVGHSLIGPHDPEHQAIQGSIVRYEYDPRRVAQLIEGLGYQKGADGMFRDTAGQTLNLEMRTRQGDDLQEKTLFGVAGYWERVGIEVEEVIFPPQRAPDREYRSTRPAFEVVRQPGGTDAIPRYHGAETPLPENNFRGANRIRYRNAQFDTLIDRFVTTIPQAERNHLLGQIIQHMTANVTVQGIYWALDPTMIGNRLTNVSGRNPTWNAHAWQVRG
jgi:peptide/nickel transport system substrate-binding protein